MIKWNPKLSVGIDDIDAQHQQLIKIVNELEEMTGEMDDETLVGLTLMKLESFAQYHFATEEKYFAEHGYPEAEEHAAKHRELSYQVKKLSGRFFNGGQDVRQELASLLAGWLEEHLTVEDQKYAEFFRERG